MSVKFTKSATVQGTGVTFKITETDSLAKQIDLALLKGQVIRRFLVQAYGPNDIGIGWKGFTTKRKALAAIDAYKGGRFGE